MEPWGGKSATVADSYVAFDVVNLRNNIVRAVMHALDALTEPVLRPIRQYVPPLGGLDMSFLVLFLLIQLVRYVVIPDIADLFQPSGYRIPE
jgi:YggT family protein